MDSGVQERWPLEDVIKQRSKNRKEEGSVCVVVIGKGYTRIVFKYAAG
jgi:hypothetical protein